MKLQDIYKEHKKLSNILLFLLLLFFGFYLDIKYNLPKTIEYATKLILPSTIKTKDITWRGDKIYIKDFKLIMRKELILDYPLVVIDISGITKTFRIKKISIDGGVANITRFKDNEINVVEAFMGKTPPDNSLPPKHYKPSNPTPIDEIVGKNITVTYRDEYYKLPIVKKVYNTSGFVTFSKTKGLWAEFKGENGKEKYFYVFQDRDEPYLNKIVLKNIKLTTQLAQYGYYNKNLHFLGGDIDIDMVIAKSGLSGYASLVNGEISCDFIQTPIKDINCLVKFLPKGITLTSDLNIFGKKEKFNLTYDDKKLKFDGTIKKFTNENLKKITFLKNVKLKMDLDDIKFYFYNDYSAIDMKLDIGNIKIGKYNIKNSKTLWTLDDKNGNEINCKIDSVNDISFLKNKTYDFKYKLDKDILKFNFKSDIINTNGNYDMKNQILKLYERGFYIDYDLKDKELVGGSGNIPIDIFGNRFLVRYIGSDNKINVKNISIFTKYGITKNFASGDINLNLLKYNFNLSGEKISLYNFFDSTSNLPLLSGSIKGQISGDNKDIKTNINLNGFNINYFANIKNCSGNLVIDSQKNIYQYVGEIGNISYNDYGMSGFLMAVRYKNDKLNIRAFKNRYFSLDGFIDLKNEKIKLSTKIKEFPLEKLNIKKPNIFIRELDATIVDNLLNPKGNINVKDIEITVDNGIPIKIKGDISLREGFAYTNIKVDSNIIKIKYQFVKDEYSGTINILDENIGRYYGNSTIQYRVIGLLRLKGHKKSITANLQANIDKVYYAGHNLPNIYLVASYNTKKIGSGTLNIENMQFMNHNLAKLFKARGSYDIDNKKLNITVPTQIFAINKIEEYLFLKNLDGKVLIDGEISGIVPEIKYFLNMNSQVLGKKDIKFKNIKFRLKGDMTQANLDEFSFRYKNNFLLSRGSYDILAKDYLYNLKSNHLELDFLNIFLEKYEIKDIGGVANFDINLTNTLNNGYININGFGLDMDKFYLHLKDFKTNIEIQNNIIYTKYLRGRLNDGAFSFNGKLSLPTMDEIIANPYFYENISYKANLELKHMQYKFKDYLDFDIDTHLSLENQKLRGDFTVNKGSITKSPTSDESIFDKIIKFLFKNSSETIKNSQEIGDDFAIKAKIEDAFDINLGILIKDGIKLDIEHLVPMVDDVKGIILGGGRITGKSGKYVFTGNFESKGASFSVNDSTFYLTKGLVAFNNKKDYFPNVNPNILVNAIVTTNGDRMNVGLTGTLHHLQFSLSDKNGSTSGSLNSFLFGKSDDELNKNFVTNIIGGQVSQIIKPVSNVIKKLFGFSEFKITSNFTPQKVKQLNNEQALERYNFGAVLEAEKNLYKDKIWWVAKGNLMGNNGSNRDDDGMFKTYDMSLVYRFDFTKSIGIGIEKINEKIKKDNKIGSLKNNEERLKKNLNYHIDLKYQKNYDSFWDIFNIN